MRSVKDQTTAVLDIANMVGVFIVLASFTILAIAVDIGERLYRWMHEKAGVFVRPLLLINVKKNASALSSISGQPASWIAGGCFSVK